MSAPLTAAVQSVESRLGLALRARRDRLGLSRKQMAHRIGITVNMYAQREGAYRAWGNGVRSSTKQRLLEVTGWSDELFDHILDTTSDLDLASLAMPRGLPPDAHRHLDEAHRLLDELEPDRLGAALAVLRRIGATRPLRDQWTHR